MKLVDILKRVIFYPVILLFIVFEELVYKQIALPIFNVIKNWRLIARLNGFIGSQNRYVILFIFLLFFVSLEILGITSLMLFAKGVFLFGVIMCFIKSLIALYSFIILELQKEKLFIFAWF